VHAVLAGLMDRLARYAATDASSLARLTAMHAFNRFKDAITHILTAQVCGAVLYCSACGLERMM